MTITDIDDFEETSETIQEQPFAFHVKLSFI
jgi:hypothetical protein